VAIADSTGTVIIGYLYSAYGYPTLLKTDSAVYNDLKYLNPFMYRGYVYDIESGLYYLQSRYYDPELGRFINADAYVSTGQRIIGHNMFAYCQNNPVVYADPSGYMPEYQGDPEYGQAWDFGQWLYEKLKEAKEKHYSRNDNNPAFPEEFDPEYFEDWDDGVSANCHQFTSENKNNKKYVSPDGRYEAIYDEDNHLVTDPRDVGTYNYASPDDIIGHLFLDIVPWILWGNSPEDSTDRLERLLGSFGI